MTDFTMSGRATSGDCGCATCAGLGDARPAQRAFPRRSFLALGAAAGLAGVSALAPGRAGAHGPLGPDAALARLMAGNARYVAGDMTSFKANLAALRASTVDKQTPFAAVLSCADSRVPVEIVFDESIGSIFVTRVAGNVASTETIASMRSTASPSSACPRSWCSPTRTAGR